MLLEGSCHCGAVKFRVNSRHPYPYNICYCSICRKTTGGGGFAINIKGDFATLEVEGREHIKIYRARRSDRSRPDAVESEGQRHFCGECGSQLWMWDPNWPEMVHPLASAIDTPLPVPPVRTHLMLGSKAAWVSPEIRAGDKQFDGYPDEGISEWHERLGLTLKD